MLYEPIDYSALRCLNATCKRVGADYRYTVMPADYGHTLATCSPSTGAANHTLATCCPVNTLAINGYELRGQSSEDVNARIYDLLRMDW